MPIADQSFVAQLFNGLADLVNDVGLDAFGRLVEQQHLGMGEQRAADGQLLLLAAAQDAAFALKEILENREERQDPLHFALISGLGQSRQCGGFPRR